MSSDGVTFSDVFVDAWQKHSKDCVYGDATVRWDVSSVVIRACSLHIKIIQRRCENVHINLQAYANEALEIIIKIEPTS